MKYAMRLNASDVEAFIDPTTQSGLVSVFNDALGQEGQPFVLFVQDPPKKTRERHYHHGDVLYFYTHGEHHIEGEGIYRAGDVRWTRAGHAYGPETTGPEGGSWWVASYEDPIPVNAPVEADGNYEEGDVRLPDAKGELKPDALPVFAPKPDYDWPEIDRAVLEVGGAILQGFLPLHQLNQINAEFDAFLEASANGKPDTGDKFYDLFLGHKTTRLHGLADKFKFAAGLIADPRLVSWADRCLVESSHAVQLNAGELIQIGAGETAQYLHRDSDSWPGVDIGKRPIVVNAIFALDDFTLENGATHLALDSWKWERHRQPKANELARAVMTAGDVALFRADLVHGGGANNTSARRRGLSLTYCAGWLRPVENSILNVPPQKAALLPPELVRLLGYAVHDATADRGGILGLYEGGDPSKILLSGISK